MAKTKAPARIAARVLAACQLGPGDAVVELSAEEAAQFKASGLVDDHPDAVAYARSLQAQHTLPEH
jgi:hypothetical protein